MAGIAQEREYEGKTISKTNEKKIMSRTIEKYITGQKQYNTIDKFCYLLYIKNMNKSIAGGIK